MRGWSSAELTRVSREDLTERLSMAALASDIGFEAKKEWEFGPKRSQVKEGVGVGVEALKQAGTDCDNPKTLSPRLARLYYDGIYWQAGLIC
jgi:hypothetical protein